jgi:fused signal recognition particle receptor
MSKGFFQSLFERISAGPVDWDALEESLLRADLGVRLTEKILGVLRDRWGLDAATAARLAREQVCAAFPPDAAPPALPATGRPCVVVMLGVNGTGKTTSTAKLAAWLRARSHTCLMVAADTFRAAAIEQIEAWGSRLGTEVISGKYGGDPAALCHDAWTSARHRNTDFLLCDTAGRLHTKGNLMQELAKVCRTLAKQDPAAPHEKLLVVDATTGSNAVAQAREFHAAVGLTGVVVTKLDGSGKGGVAAAIGSELGIPTRFTGHGEGIEDFALFDAGRYVEEMF